MSRVLKICAICAQNLFGFKLTPIYRSEENAKCDLCKKKRICKSYHVEPERRKETTDA